MSPELLDIDDCSAGFADADYVFAFEKNRQNTAETIRPKSFETLAVRLISLQVDDNVYVLIELNCGGSECEFTGGVGVSKTNRLPAIVFETHFDHRKVEAGIGDKATGKNEVLGWRRRRGRLGSNGRSIRSRLRRRRRWRRLISS